MTTREETTATTTAPVFTTPPVKKLRFRGDLNMHHFGEARVEDIFDEPDGAVGGMGRGRGRNNATQQPEEANVKGVCVFF